MAKRKKKEHDFAVTAFRVMQEAVGDSDNRKAETDPLPPGASPRAMAGRLGGLRGGKARATKLTPAQRKAIARKAAAARWKK